MGNSTIKHNTDGDVSNVASVTLDEAYTLALSSKTWTTVTDGVDNMSVTITPTTNTSKILVMVHLLVNSGYTWYRILRDGSPVCVGDAAGSRVRATFGGEASAGAGGISAKSYAYLDSPSTTSAVTYTIEAYKAAGSLNLLVNKTLTDTDSTAYVRGVSQLIAWEVAQS